MSRDADGLDERGRLLEVVTVVILGVATVASAWCAFQSSRWNDRSDDDARIATDARVEQSRLYSKATTTIVYDSNIVIAYAAAVADENDKLIEFYRTKLVRPEFLPIIDEWRTSVASGSTDVTNLLENEEYLASLFTGSKEAEQQVINATADATTAGEYANDYLLTTLFMASALFFAGVVSSFKVRSAKGMLLLGAMFLLALGAARIAGLPIA